MSNIEKLQKARQSNVEVGDKVFIISRPTPMQAMDWLIGVDGDPLSPDDIQQFIAQNFSLRNQAWRRIALQAIDRFVVGWQGVNEIDLIPGGTGIALAWDRELFMEWVQDYPDIITQLGYAIFESWIRYLNAQGELEKKPLTGTSPEPSADNPTV